MPPFLHFSSRHFIAKLIGPEQTELAASEYLGIFFLSFKSGLSGLLDCGIYFGFCFPFSVNQMPTKTYYHG